MGGGGSLMAAA